MTDASFWIVATNRVREAVGVKEKGAAGSSTAVRSSYMDPAWAHRYANPGSLARLGFAERFSKRFLHASRP